MEKAIRQATATAASYLAERGMSYQEEELHQMMQQQRALEERRWREAEGLEDERRFLVAQMICEPGNEAYWRDTLQHVDPLMSEEDISSRMSQAHRDPPYYSADEILSRSRRYREYPPPGPGDHASGADR